MALLMLGIYQAQVFGGFITTRGNPGEAEDIRPPAVAGRFYPADAKKLRSALELFFQHSQKPDIPYPKVIIVPHAGYIYSGQICAEAFSAVQGGNYEVVVILGTNHTTAPFHKAAVYARGGYQTPLGIARVEEFLAGRLIDQHDLFMVDSRVHEWEHSLEVIVPFIQYALPGVKIIPIVVGSTDYELCSGIGHALADLMRTRKALIIASSDLSHYPPYAAAREIDHETISILLTQDSRRLQDHLQNLVTRRVPRLVTGACGEGPLLTALVAARKLGARTGILISYANSGDVAAGDHSRVVGYAGVAFVPEYQQKKQSYEIQ